MTAVALYIGVPNGALRFTLFVADNQRALYLISYI